MVDLYAEFRGNCNSKMNALNWTPDEHQCSEGTLSLTDVRKKLFPAKLQVDRAPVLTEDKYTPKTLVGNWFERRAINIPQSNDWRTLYEIDFSFNENKAWEPNQISKWNNKLNFEGSPQEVMVPHKEEYYNNMTTSYDLCYNILSKEVPRIRSYNTRQKKWIPEQDLLKSFGSLTQFGLRDALKEELYRFSEQGIRECRWSTTYSEEIGQLLPANIERNTQFHRRIVNFNIPDLRHFERRSADMEKCLLPLKFKS